MARVLRWEHTWTRRPRRRSRFSSRPSTRSRWAGPASPDGPGKRPDRLIADRGYDSNPLRARLALRGIEPIIPARANHNRATHQDGRKLRRYRRRWIVERTFAWLGHFRRLVVRYERLITTYAGFFHIACALLTLRRVLK